MCPIFRSRFTGTAVFTLIYIYIYVLFPVSPAFPPSAFYFPFFFFHYACLRDAHRVSPVSIRAETAAEKYLALTRRSSTQMGIESRLESFSRLQPSIRACQKLRRVGRKGRFEKGVYDRRWQADGFRLRQRRGERKRKIFHGFHSSIVAIACFRRTFFLVLFMYTINT